ncbi:MAG: protein kinase [Acidobacteriota bacterium]
MIEAGNILQQRYHIDEQIGQGGMGAVYVATDERFGSIVAIKETLCMDDNFRKAIEREARLLNSLRHAALPRVSDHFEENDSQFLVMEYIQGEDLGHILDEQQQPFEVDQVVTWADQLLDALDFLHNQDVPVIHRDIKPQNLKITSAGQIILLDFGLAKGNPTDAGHQTAAKSIFGYSRNYASLEQIQGTGTDPRSDLYSLAATLYHLLTGVAPADALTRAMSVLGQRADPLVPASTVRPDVPRGIAGVLQRSLDLNADGRPSSASEMRKMFQDSRSYEHLADYSTLATANTEAHVNAQPTQLMPETTNIGGIAGVEAKTEMMPAQISEQTAVRLQSPATKNGIANATVGNASALRRRKSLAATVGGLLLVGVAAAGGVYYYQNPQPSAAPTVENVDQSAAAPATTVNAVTPTEAPLANANSAAPGAGEKAKVATLSKSSESSKDPKAPSVAKPKPGDQTIDIAAPPDEDIPGDVVVTHTNPDGSTTTTRILKNGVPPKGRRKAPDTINPFPDGFDPRYLTPAQRKKLRNVMRPDGTVIFPPTPPKQ